MKWFPANPIRVFALICVAVTSGFFGYLAIHLITILSSPDWCGKAMQAERILPGTQFQGLIGCIDIMKLQVGSLAKALLIVIGTFALCLGVLMVIVVAGAKLAGKIMGNEIDVSRDRTGETPVAKAATTVAAAADTAAKQVVAAQPPPGTVGTGGEDG